MAKVVLAFDKFRGTATASELTRAVAAAVPTGNEVVPVPLADGGEGSLEVLGGPNKFTEVTGPLGDPVRAGWRLEGREAFIEMAAASGLVLVGGQEGNDPLAADTLGTGELIHTAVEMGARVITVFLGGSATTDGGWGALRALPPAPRMKEIDLVVATDVDTFFTDAGVVFGPQKGASPAQVKLLTGRLQRLTQVYSETYGREVGAVPGAGAAGGLAGGLYAVGGRIESGFDVLAERSELDIHLEDADLVITGEGYMDDESFNGKVVGGVADWAKAAGTATLAIVGDMDADLAVPDGNFRAISLTERFGQVRAMEETSALVAQVASEAVSALG